MVEVKRNALEDVSQERRRSTPTVSRRCSLQKNRFGPVVDRTDVWPEPKHMSEVEERFLKLPDSDDYTRVRQFKIDSKGAVVNRGDSFRRKRNRNIENSPSPFPGDDSPRGTESRSVSISSGGSIIGRGGQSEFETATTSHNVYKIYVLGATGSGKSSLIGQFITSEYRNAFADEIEVQDNMVSINIGGKECDLLFFEADPTMDPTWKSEDVQGYLLVYSIDSKSSFRTAMNTIEEIRELNNGLPIILAGNKIDLERKRAIASNEVKNVALTYGGIANFEISVALNHDVDDLLVGIVAEIKESFKTEKLNDENRPLAIKPEIAEKIAESDDFKAAIRRFSQRKKRQMGVAAANLELETSKCTNLSPTNLFERFRNWRKGTSKC
uniref:Uncharacterized protein n=1 Tax=Acrobeloides nanus TaxID=290746 RepID=A0A914DT79_9BILA